MPASQPSPRPELGSRHPAGADRLEPLGQRPLLLSPDRSLRWHQPRDAAGRFMKAGGNSQPIEPVWYEDDRGKLHPNSIVPYWDAVHDDGNSGRDLFILACIVAGLFLIAAFGNWLVNG